jgi:hypothetical protein
LFTQEMRDALQRGPSGGDQTLPKHIRLRHGRPPKRLAQHRMALYFPIQFIAVDHADRAACQSLYTCDLSRSRERKTVKPEVISRVMKCIYVSSSILLLGRKTRNAFELYREMFRQTGSSDNGPAAGYSGLHLHELAKCIQIGTCGYTQSPEPLTSNAYESHCPLTHRPCYHPFSSCKRCAPDFSCSRTDLAALICPLGRARKWTLRLKSARQERV